MPNRKRGDYLRRRLSTGTLQPLEDPHSSRHPWNPGSSKVGLQGAPRKPVILAAGERKPHRSAPPPVAEATTAAQLLPWKQSSLPLVSIFWVSSLCLEVNVTSVKRTIYPACPGQCGLYLFYKHPLWTITRVTTGSTELFSKFVRGKEKGV